VTHCTGTTAELQIQLAVLWMNIHKNWGISQSVFGIAMLVTGHSKVIPKFSLVLQHVPKLIMIIYVVYLYRELEVLNTLKDSQNALLGSDSLLKLMLLSFHSTSTNNSWWLPVTTISFSDATIYIPTILTVFHREEVLKILHCYRCTYI